MAVATATVLALAGLGAGAAQYAQAKKQQKSSQAAAKAAADSIAGLKESNPFAAVQVPTLGFDLAQQGIDRQTAASVNALQGAGAEGVIGGIGNVVQNNNQAELQLAADANNAAYQRDVNEANAQTGINTRKIGRDTNLQLSKLEGAQAASAQAQENKNAAIAGMMGSAGTALSTGIESSKLYKTQKLASDPNANATPEDFAGTGVEPFPTKTPPSNYSSVGQDEFGNIIYYDNNGIPIFY